MSATAELKKRGFVPPSAGRDDSVHPKTATSSSSAHSFSDRSPVATSGQVQLQLISVIVCQIFSEPIIHLACRKYGCSFVKIIIVIILQHNSIYTSDKVNFQINILM